MSDIETPFLPTACPHDCPSTCALEVERLAPDRIGRVRGAADNSYTAGVICEKVARYAERAHNPGRLTTPLRRKPDGSFEEIDWDTAIREVAAGFRRIQEEHGGESIFYYGGGGQGNHLPAAYSRSTRALLGSRYRSNALFFSSTIGLAFAKDFVSLVSRNHHQSREDETQVEQAF